MSSHIIQARTGEPLKVWCFGQIFFVGNEAGENVVSDKKDGMSIVFGSQQEAQSLIDQHSYQNVTH